MGTAMYDLAAIMADKHFPPQEKVRIVRDPNQSLPAQRMWAKHEDKDHWPVKTET
jgi:hypothetical protein